jgi:Zn-dependent peptidase ImmA (M78 family)
MLTAEHRAQTLLDRLKQGSPAANVNAIAQALDIDVHYAALEGFSVVTFWRGRQMAALVNMLQPNYRQRFALAHAIGHTQLHPDRAFACTLVAPEVTAPIRRVEREASRFAAALLMPEWAVRWFHGLGFSDEEMAQALHVSKETVYWRLHHLGLMREQRYRPTAD